MFTLDFGDFFSIVEASLDLKELCKTSIHFWNNIEQNIQFFKRGISLVMSNLSNIDLQLIFIYFIQTNMSILKLRVTVIIIIINESFYFYQCIKLINLFSETTNDIHL